MQFVRIGEFFAAARITGPHHNLLQIRLGLPEGGKPTCECLQPTGGCKHEPLNESTIIDFVQEGIAEANARFGSTYSVSNIRYVENDTKPEAVYGLLALKIIEHLETGGIFEPSVAREGRGQTDAL